MSAHDNAVQAEKVMHATIPCAPLPPASVEDVNRAAWLAIGYAAAAWAHAAVNVAAAARAIEVRAYSLGELVEKILHAGHGMR